jgi:PhnB protein
MSTENTALIPMLAYEDGVAAMDWLCKAFGFAEKARMLDEHGKLAHGELTFGTGIIMLASPTKDYQSPRHHRQVCDVAARWYQSPYIFNGVLVFVPDIEAHYQQAKAHGTTILSEIERGGPGPRYRVEDLEGHRWMFIERN